MPSDALLTAGLNPEQLKAVKQTEGPVLTARLPQQGELSKQEVE